MKKIFFSLFLICIILFLSGYVFFKNQIQYLYAVPLHLGMISLAMFFLWKGSIEKTFEELDFPGNFWNNLKYFFIGYGLIITVLLISGIIFLYFGIVDQQRVQQTIKEFPLYVLFLAVFVAPIGEELLFRGYLTNRIGVIPAALVFGVLHIGYGSIVEIFATTMIAIILGFIFRWSKSITPCILIHMAYNLISVVITRLFL